MQNVGTAELKNRLSEYLRRVRSGEGFLVTDRGHAIAKLEPVRADHAASLQEKLSALITSGYFTRASTGGGVFPKRRRERLRKGASASAMVIAERDEE